MVVMVTEEAAVTVNDRFSAFYFLDTYRHVVVLGDDRDKILIHSQMTCTQRDECRKMFSKTMRYDL